MSLQTIESLIAQIDGVSVPAAAASSADSDAFTQLTQQTATLTDDATVAPQPPLDRSAIERTAAANGVDPALVMAVIENESSFNARAASPAGAMGLMQLMPDTARAFNVSDPYDPAQNVAAGTAYLHSLLDRFHGNTALAVAAYNAGPGAVERSGGIPPFPETQRYVGAVLAACDRWRTHS